MTRAQSGWLVAGIFAAGPASSLPGRPSGTATLAPGPLWGGGNFATFQARTCLLETGGSIFVCAPGVSRAHPLILSLARGLL